MARVDGLRPCPSKARMYLGFPQQDGVEVPCSMAIGHLGRHVYHAEWDDDSTPNETASDLVKRHLDSRRADAGFMSRLRGRMAKDKAILDRLTTPAPDAAPSGEATDGTTPTKEA